ncbi:MAG: YeeE/YedE family protein [Bdellovibrionales bacterium]|nr:YeeE/YedE family protein [Bdellovibrionales bacterium]
MKNFIHNLIAINLGMIFAGGLVISGMTQPKKIIDFLDITGSWNPALLLVMLGAIGVYMPVYYFVIKKKEKPLLEEKFFIPTNGKVDKKLIFGSAIFGIGWGASGLCPGPALTSLVANNQAWIYVLSLIAGMLMAKFITNYKRQNA